MFEVRRLAKLFDSLFLNQIAQPQIAMQEQPRMVMSNVCCFFNWLIVYFLGHFLGDNLYPFASTHCPPWHLVFDFRLESHRLTRVYTNPSLFDDAAPATPFIFQIFWARGNWRWLYPSNKTTALKTETMQKQFFEKKHGETNWKHPVASVTTPNRGPSAFH